MFWLAGAGEVLASIKLADVRVSKAPNEPSVKRKYAAGTPDGSCFTPCSIAKPAPASGPALALSRKDKLSPACTYAAISVGLAFGTEAGPPARNEAMITPGLPPGPGAIPLALARI